LKSVFSGFGYAIVSVFKSESVTMIGTPAMSVGIGAVNTPALVDVRELRNWRRLRRVINA
jgi:hypothetical protein